MCNLYDVGPAPRYERFQWESAVREAAGSMTYAAPGKPGLVVRLQAGAFRPAAMRWGFHRDWSPYITNARDDKLGGRMWAEAWAGRRCVLPVRRFYEWSGPKGAKTKHAIAADADYWFWIAGIWEENPNRQIGPSYAMLTTGASDLMQGIHDRMPVVLHPQGVEEYLASSVAPMHLVKPYDGELSISPPVDAGGLGI